MTDTATAAEKGRGDDAGQSGSGLTITDNRTGRSYDVEITDNTIKAADIGKIRTDDETPGLAVYDPGFTNTASCRSAVTFIDGEKGILEYRGYPIEQLAEKSTFLEVAYLLIHGELPTRDQYDSWVHEITFHTFVHENVRTFMQGFRYDAHPMGMLMASIGALSTFYPESNNIKDPDNRHIQIVRMIAKMPTLGRLGLPARAGQAVRLPGQRAELHRELPLDAVQDERAEVRRRRAPGQGARRAVHPARRPRAELLDQRGALRRLEPGGPVLRDRGRRSPRSTARCTAAPTRPCSGCSSGSARRTTSPASSRA